MGSEARCSIWGVPGEGAKDFRVDECAVFKDITTATDFSNLQFSARHHGSNSSVLLLRSLLHYDGFNTTHDLVFTHGDVRTGNIMAKRDPYNNGQYLGILSLESLIGGTAAFIRLTMSVQH